eukprot:scaffold125477_cov60-Phaeocystis_antarctica.AAC.2
MRFAGFWQLHTHFTCDPTCTPIPRLVLLSLPRRARPSSGWRGRGVAAGPHPGVSAGRARPRACERRAAAAGATARVLSAVRAAPVECSDS